MKASRMQFLLIFLLLGCTTVTTLSTKVSAADTQLQNEIDPTAPVVVLTNAMRDTLLASAREFLNHRNQNLIVGAATKSLNPAHPVSTALASRNVREETVLRDRAERLNALGEAYTGFSTDVRLIHARKIKGKIVALIEEATKFDYAQVNGDEPPSTGFKVEREFVFEKDVSGRWILDDMQYLGGGLAPINEVEGAAEDRGQGDFGLEKSPVPASDAPINGSPNNEKAKMDDQQAAALIANDTATVNYATKYALKYNSAYRSFHSDCTNFISQAMYAGGWSMVYGSYSLNSSWWYNWLNQSYPWAGAENWYWFARGKGRTTYLSNVWYMQLGDILQADWQRDGTKDHTMIVTKAATSDLYLTYHSTDTLNRSLKSIIAQYPSAWYYAHRTL